MSSNIPNKKVPTFSSSSCKECDESNASESNGPDVIFSGPLFISNTVNLNWATNSPKVDTQVKD